MVAKDQEILGEKQERLGEQERNQERPKEEKAGKISTLFMS
jgi:hypothetical protein